MTGGGSMLCRDCTLSPKELHVVMQEVGRRAALNIGESSPAAATRGIGGLQIIWCILSLAGYTTVPCCTDATLAKHCVDQPSCSL